MIKLGIFGAVKLKLCGNVYELGGGVYSHNFSGIIMYKLTAMKYISISQKNVWHTLNDAKNNV